MARAFSCCPGRPPRFLAWALLCLLLLSHAAWAAVLNGLEVSNDGPITTGAQATLYSTLHVKNEGPASTHEQKYHFKWVYAPLTLVEESEHGATSRIVVTSPFPGIFPVAVQLVHTSCWFCPALTRGLTVVQVSEFIVGNLSVTQIEDSSIPEKLGSRPVEATPVLASFLLHDPSHYFKMASFVYKWDFGDGTKLRTDDPSVYHNYSTPGTCVVHLDVMAEWRKHRMKAEHSRKVVRKTGHFVAALELLDAVQSINITGSTEAHVMENLNFSLHIQGSPPLSLCWLIKSECVPLEGDQCRLVVTNATDYHLNHVFSHAGQYCLSVRVENGVNMLQSYQEIQVKPLGIHPAVFVLPSITLLSVVVGLAVYVTFRGNPQQKDLVEVADFDFSPMSDKTPSGSGWSCGQVCCQNCLLGPAQEPCNTTVREHHRLLDPLRKPAKMYTR